jgi:hypothetical protein
MKKNTRVIILSNAAAVIFNQNAKKRSGGEN